MFDTSQLLLLILTLLQLDISLLFLLANSVRRPANTIYKLMIATLQDHQP
ncbi:hypothetical protein BC941DRAFT_476928 [Chlamydoabsidia padenii]|nr:hypothetical protein BC941DRAFT_476928 [Chlamydoabsidia padenii]